MNPIIKRAGHKETFDERKLYASIYAAALVNHRHEETAELIAALAIKTIKQWMKKKKEITSEQLAKETVRTLKRIDREVAYLYETHRDIA